MSPLMTAGEIILMSDMKCISSGTHSLFQNIKHILIPDEAMTDYPKSQHSCKFFPKLHFKADQAVIKNVEFGVAQVTELPETEHKMVLRQPLFHNLQLH